MNPPANPLPMRFKKGDRVKLPMAEHLPTFCYQPPAASMPVWGGPLGYHYGVVNKVVTHQHDDTYHKAEVTWDNNEMIAVPDTYLAPLAAEERDVALDTFNDQCPVDNDIWMLLRTAGGRFALNVIETTPLGKDPTVRYAAGLTRLALPNVDNSDYNLVSLMLSLPDYHECQYKSLFDAAASVFSLWSLPPLDAIPLPLPTFESVRYAASTVPRTPGVAACWFHLPNRIVDYCDHPPSSAAA